MNGFAAYVTAIVLLGDGGQPPVPRDHASESGTIHFKPIGDETTISERYRLSAHDFSYELTRHREMPGCRLDIYHLRFPSPVQTSTVDNNTVHAEYYRPRGAGPFPGVVILDITAGDQILSRTIATVLAQNQIAGLFVQMAYYGPRRPPGSRQRLLSVDYRHTMEAVRQTVLDLRRASAWLESRSEIDRARIGILGTSLGSLVGTLAAEMEPRYQRVVIILGGGGLVDAYYDYPKAWLLRQVFEACGGTKEQLKQLIAPVDPITCAGNLKGRRVLMIAGLRDQVVPPIAAMALWKAAGEPRIIWYNCTHLGAAAYFIPAMQEVTRHLRS